MSISRQQFVNTVNQHLDLPFFGEAAEAHMIDICVGTLWSYIPAVVWDTAANAADGLTAAEIDHLLEGAVDLAAKNMRISYIPEAIRRQILQQLVVWLREYCQIDKSLAWATN